MKNDILLGHVIEIKETLGRIDGHLNELNGKTKRNQEDIDALYSKFNKLDKKLAYYGGIAVVGFSLLNFIFPIIIKRWMGS